MYGLNVRMGGHNGAGASKWLCGVLPPFDQSNEVPGPDELGQTGDSLSNRCGLCNAGAPP